MNESKIQKIVDLLTEHLPSDLNGAERADVYVFLGKEIGMSHLLLPDARPDKFYKVDLPSIAPELYNNRLNKRETSVQFIARVYKKWLGNGLAQNHIRHLDHSLYHAYHNWLRKNKKPDWLDLPTKKELNDKELEEIGINDGDTLPHPSYYTGLKDKIRLYNAARNRALKNKGDLYSQ